MSKYIKGKTLTHTHTHTHTHTKLGAQIRDKWAKIGWESGGFLSFSQVRFTFFPLNCIG